MLYFSLFMFLNGISLAVSDAFFIVTWRIPQHLLPFRFTCNNMGKVETLSFYFRGPVTKMSLEAYRRMSHASFSLIISQLQSYKLWLKPLQKDILFSAEICFTEGQPPWPSTPWIIISMLVKIWAPNIHRITQKKDKQSLVNYVLDSLLPTQTLVTLCIDTA